MSIVARFTKVKANKLLNRVQMIVDAFHPPDMKVTKEQIKEKVKEKFKKPHISIFGMKKLYGGGRTKCYCLIFSVSALLSLEGGSNFFIASSLS